jgi:YHS domain-containing protein
MKRVCGLLAPVLLFLSGCGTAAPSKPAQKAGDMYPLDVCVVCGEKLGSMGEPHVIKYQGKTVKFCCSKCLPEFNADTAKYMAILEKAEKAAGKMK